MLAAFLTFAVAASTDDPSPASDDVTLLYESAGKLPAFMYGGADLEEPGMLEKVVQQVMYRKEIILVCGDAKPTASSANGLNTLMQLRALNLHHVLYLSDSAASCAAVRLAMPDIACVWSSRIPSTKPKVAGLCVQLYWGYAFYFYDLRKHYAARMTIELGINVLQTDTDVVWLANPYPALKAVFGGVQIVAMSDRPMVNAGVFYAQNVKPGDGAAWVLRELARRIHTFILRPSAVKDYVPWAQPPFFANVDEQTLMNDCVRSSIANVTSFAQATAGWEVKRHRTGTMMNKTFKFKGTPEYRLLAWLNKRVPAAGRRSRLNGPVPINQLCGAPTVNSPGTLYPLHWVGSSAPARASIAIGPSWLFMSLPSSMAASSIRRCRHIANASAARAQATAPAADGAAADGAVAAPQESPTSVPAAPFVMGHLAGVRTGAWSRRALMRAYGWWHAQADMLIARQLGWGRRTRTLELAVGDEARAWLGRAISTQAHFDLLMGNLLLLGLLANRRVVMPEMPHCSIATSPGRGYGNRPVGARSTTLGLRSQTCAWMPPKDCWAVEYVTELEHEQQRRAARAQNGVPTAGRATAECDAEARQLVHALTLTGARGAVSRPSLAARNTSLVSMRRKLRELVCDTHPALAILSATPGSSGISASLGGAQVRNVSSSGRGTAKRMQLLELLSRAPLMRHPVRQLPMLASSRIHLFTNTSNDFSPIDAKCIEALYALHEKVHGSTQEATQEVP